MMAAIALYFGDCAPVSTPARVASSSGVGSAEPVRIAWARTCTTAARSALLASLSSLSGTVLDPEVVDQLLVRRRSDPLDRLTPRELEVLRLMAEGRSNNGIVEAPRVSHSAMEKYISNIFTKLDLPPTDTDHRRVLAVLEFLRT
jgi:DNA-binding NarL/FixJ family response regulator